MGLDRKHSLPDPRGHSELCGRLGPFDHHPGAHRASYSDAAAAQVHKVHRAHAGVAAQAYGDPGALRRRSSAYERGDAEVLL